MAELMTQGEWDKYRRMLKAISDAAEQDFWNIAYKLSQEHGAIGILSVPRNELIELANALVQKYGEGAAEAACQMHEEIAERSGVSIPPAEPAELPEMHEVAKVVNGAAKSGSEKTVTSAVGRMVKQVGQDTTWKNAARDGAEWAWVPAGDTCAFCITLASRGWQHASKAVLKGGHVEHIHANCDCAFAIRFGKDQNIGGYDPDKYLRMYYGAEGNTSKDRINAMRREMYTKNSDEINARKRSLYDKQRQLSYDPDTKETISRGKSIVVQKTTDGKYGVFVSENARLKKQSLANIEKTISDSIEKLGIGEDVELPQIVVLSKDEMGTAFAAYNYVQNRLYLSDVIGNKKQTIICQNNRGYASPNDPCSTTRHEMIHWMDAEEYRKSKGVTITIDNADEYLQYLQEQGKIKLIEAGIDEDNIYKIGRHARDALLSNDYDEAYTELRTVLKE